jgi:hypothetical protein
MSGNGGERRIRVGKPLIPKHCMISKQTGRPAAMFLGCIVIQQYKLKVIEMFYQTRGFALAVVAMGMVFHAAPLSPAVVMNFDDLICAANQNDFNKQTAAMGAPGSNYVSSIKLYQKPTMGDAWIYINSDNNVTPYDGFQFQNFKLMPKSNQDGNVAGLGRFIQDIASPAKENLTYIKAQEGPNTFTFNSAAFWDPSPDSKPTVLSLTGMLNGAQLNDYNYTTTLNSTPTMYNFNWPGVDEVLISTDGNNQHLAVDDLTFNGAATLHSPEPSTLIVWSVLAALGLAGWRLKRKQPVD